MEAGGNQYVSPTPKLAEASKGETREAEFIEAIERERAKLRQTATLMQGDNKPDTPKLAERDKGETREKVAEAIGMKRGTIYRGDRARTG